MTQQSSNFTDDLDVFNYALTLEHLENAFYRDGLKEFDEAAFEDAGFDAEVRENLVRIGKHEADHVKAITATIEDAGGEPVEEAEYDFGYDDVEGFLGVAQALETTGTQAYTGAAPYIQDKDLLTAALTIHGVEARHAAYLNTVTEAEVPFPGALEPGLTRDEVLAIAGPFIVGEGTTTAVGADGATAAVDIDDYEFLPVALEIAAGTTVTWTNVGQVPHTATAEDEIFDTGVLSKGKSASYTFAEPGTYPYVCTLHPSDMKATVVVR